MKTELFKFTEAGNPEIITPLTSHSANIVFDSLTYCPELISRGEIRLLPDTARATLVVSLSIKSDLARGWLLDSRDNYVFLELYTKDGENTPTLLWKGRLIKPEAQGSIIKATFITVAGGLQRAGIRKRFQRTCPYDVYGAQCKANKELFSVSGQVVSITDGVSVVVEEAAEKPDGFYDGGLIEDSFSRKRYILTHVGNTLTLSKALASLTVGTTAILAAGCNKTTSVCAGTFNNLDNYGGFPYIPLKNPFDFVSIV